MFVTKCDLCKKEINDHPINVRFGSYENAEFCNECGSPVLKFLRKHQLIKEEDKKVKLN